MGHRPLSYLLRFVQCRLKSPRKHLQWHLTDIPPCIEQRNFTLLAHAVALDTLGNIDPWSLTSAWLRTDKHEGLRTRGHSLKSSLWQQMSVSVGAAIELNNNLKHPLHYTVDARIWRRVDTYHLTLISNQPLFSLILHYLRAVSFVTALIGLVLSLQSYSPPINYRNWEFYDNNYLNHELSLSL